MFSFGALPDCVIVEAIDALVPAVWRRLSDAVPFVGDWTWHERTMWHLCHKDVLAVRWTGNVKNGAVEWYKNGYMHRDGDLPALELADGGTKEWYANGKLHRESNGLPARVWANGTKQWWVRGRNHRDGGLPAIEWGNGSKQWWVNGRLHRDNNLPAIEWESGYKAWYTNGRLRWIDTSKVEK